MSYITTRFLDIEGRSTSSVLRLTVETRIIDAERLLSGVSTGAGVPCPRVRFCTFVGRFRPFLFFFIGGHLEGLSCVVTVVELGSGHSGSNLNLRDLDTTKFGVSYTINPVGIF